MKRTLSLSRLFIPALLLFPMLAGAAITGPYTPDVNTLHLWHFDEAAGSTAAMNEVLGKNPLLAVDGNPNTANPLPFSTSILGAEGAPGFGNAASISAGDLGLGYDGNNSGGLTSDTSTVDMISMSSLRGPNGAFTLEALVNLPSLAAAGNREIIAMDTTASATARPFQFVFAINGSVTVLRFRQFDTVNTTLEVAVPTTGDDAFQANTWFHVAYTYDGEGNGALYWTLLDGTRTEASLLGSSSSMLDVNTNNAVLVIGNENRGVFGEGLLGKIDEVRISNIERGPGDFLFAVPEPSCAVLMGMGALLLARRRRG